jgi:hypothetical protein
VCSVRVCFVCVVTGLCPVPVRVGTDAFVRPAERSSAMPALTPTLDSL